jgi:hypothetical protein
MAQMPRTLINLKTGELKRFPSGSAAKRVMKKEPGAWSRVFDAGPERPSLWRRAWRWLLRN